MPAAKRRFLERRLRSGQKNRRNRTPVPPSSHSH